MLSYHLLYLPTTIYRVENSLAIVTLLRGLVLQHLLGTSCPVLGLIFMAWCMASTVISHGRDGCTAASGTAAARSTEEQHRAGDAVVAVTGLRL